MPSPAIRQSLLALVLLPLMAGHAAAQTAPAPAAQAEGGQPIEIIADSLTVEQEKQLATFTGNVDAVQGNLKLKADKLLVFYEQGKAAAQNQAQGGQGIERLEATGNVFLNSGGDTARGDRGVYLVAGGMITLEGNVVLTRAQNVIRGARLESNVRTGVSTMTAPQGSKPGERVRAVFVQQQAGKKAP